MQAQTCPKPTYKRRRPDQTLLYKTIAEHFESFKQSRDDEGSALPEYVSEEFRSYLKCGILNHGFIRVRCTECEHEFPLALSCKKRGFCASCCGKRMVECAAHLVDNVLPAAPYRQWIVTLPVPLRFWIATSKKLASEVHRLIIDQIDQHYTHNGGEPGSITFIQRFGSALNYNYHFHILYLDGVYKDAATPR